MIEGIKYPIPVVHQKVILKEPYLDFQVVVISIFLLRHLLFRLKIICHSTFHKMLLSQSFKNRVIGITRKFEELPILSSGVHSCVNFCGWPLCVDVAQEVSF